MRKSTGIILEESYQLLFLWLNLNLLALTLGWFAYQNNFLLLARILSGVPYYSSILLLLVPLSFFVKILSRNKESTSTANNCTPKYYYPHKIHPIRLKIATIISGILYKPYSCIYKTKAYQGKQNTNYQPYLHVVFPLYLIVRRIIRGVKIIYQPKTNDTR